MRIQKLAKWILMCLPVLVASWAEADSIIKTNGASVAGTIVEERPDAVVIEVESSGIVFRQTIKRAQIRSIQRDKPLAGPTYCKLPVLGAIGTDCTADALMEGFADAKTSHPQYIVLVIDSPGGDVAEAIRILGLIRQYRDLQPVAYVKRAAGAAMAIALACPRICMAPDATLGPWAQSKTDGKRAAKTGQLSGEVTLSAIRAAIAAAGHDGLWVRGMTEPEVELAVVTNDGKPKLVQATRAAGQTIVKRKGKALSLTAADAQASGLSLGSAADVEAVHVPLGLDAWHSAGERAWAAAMGGAKAAQHSDDGPARDTRHNSASADAKVRELKDSAAAADSAAQKLKAQWKQEADAIEADYQQTIAQAQGSGEYPLIQSRADRVRQRKLDALKRQYQPQIDRYERTANEDTARAKRLLAQSE